MWIRIGIWLLAVVLAGEAPAAVAATRAMHHLTVTRMYRVQSNEFSVAVPNAGWSASSSMSFGNQYTELLTIGPRAGTLPQAYVYTMLPITTMASGFIPRLQRCVALKKANPFFDSLTCVRGATQVLIAASQHRYTASESASIISQFAPSVGVRMEITSSRNASPDRVDLNLRTIRQGVAADEVAVVRVFHVYDPAIAAFVPQSFATYAIVEGCRAAPGTLNAAMPLCNEVFRSFRPAPGWLQQRVAAAAQDNRQLGQIVAQLIRVLVEDQAQASAMINRTMSNIGQMQMQSEMNAMAVKTQIDDGWIKSLGSQTYFFNKENPNEYYSTNESYNYYCQNTFNGQFWGTNNPLDLNKPECGRRYDVDVP